MRGVVYFLWGSGHAPLLVVSLYSLRKWWHGPVAIMTPENHSTHISPKIALDYRLRVSVEYIPLCSGRRNSANCTKTYLHKYVPYDPCLFIDADTFVTGDLEGIFPTLDQEITLTSFSNWRTRNCPYEGRVQRFKEFVPELVERKLLENPVAVNTGVFAFWKRAKVLDPVHELCVRARRVFIPDEISMHLLYEDYPHRLVDDRWNWSPKFGKAETDIRIVHCHGSKVYHPKIKETWLGLAKSVWEGNYGKIQEWADPAAKSLLLGEAQEK